MAKKEQSEQELWAKVSSGEGDEKAQALMALGHKAFHKGDHKEALAMSETAREVYESMGATASSAALGHVYQSIGWSLKALKRYEEAAGAAHKAAELYKEIGDKDLFYALNEEGDYWYSAKNWQKSYEVHSAALAEINPDLNEETLAVTYGHCAFALGRLDRWAEALEHFLQSRALFKKLKNPWQVAFADEEISLCYSKLGNGVEALVYAQRAMDFAVVTQHQYRLIWSNARMGLAKKLLGEYEEALEHIATAKDMMLGTGEPYWSSIVRMDKIAAGIQRERGLVEEADEILRRLKVIEETLDGDDEVD